MKTIQRDKLKFLDDSNNTEENYQNLIKLFEDQKIQENKQELKSTLHLITKIDKIISFFASTICMTKLTKSYHFSKPNSKNSIQITIFSTYLRATSEFFFI